jgi:hypothetical protein
MMEALHLARPLAKPKERRGLAVAMQAFYFLLTASYPLLTTHCLLLTAWPSPCTHSSTSYSLKLTAPTHRPAAYYPYPSPLARPSPHAGSRWRGAATCSALLTTYYSSLLLTHRLRLLTTTHSHYLQAFIDEELPRIEAARSNKVEARVVLHLTPPEEAFDEALKQALQEDIEDWLGVGFSGSTPRFQVVSGQ